MKFISLTQKVLLMALIAFATPVLAHDGCGEDHPEEGDHRVVISSIRPDTAPTTTLTPTTAQTTAATANTTNTPTGTATTEDGGFSFLWKPFVNVGNQLTDARNRKKIGVGGVVFAITTAYVNSKPFEGPHRCSIDGVKKALKQCGTSAKQTRTAVVGILGQIKYFFQDCIIGHGFKKAKKDGHSCNASSGHHHHDKNKGGEKDIPSRGIVGNTISYVLKPLFKPFKKTAKEIKLFATLSTGNIVAILAAIGDFEDKPKCGCSH